MHALPPPPPVQDPATHLLYAWEGAVPADRFGAAVSLGGDVDGDGRADVLVGAPLGGAGSGLAILYGGADGMALLTLPGAAAGSGYGSAVELGGDVDGDGRSDLALGAPLAAAGSVELRGGVDGGLLQAWSGNAPGDRFGASLAFVGDLDADGFADLAVGAPYADLGGTNAGRVVVRSGRDGTELFAREGAAWDFLATSVSAAGDTNADGLADLLVGAPFSDTGAFNAGSAYVLSGVDGAELAAFHAEQIGDQLGNWTAGAGDTDGDGVADLALGAPGSDAGGLDSGAAEVRAGSDGSLVLTVAGSGSGEYAGTVAGAGDTDGDGSADLWFGASSSDVAGTESGTVRLVSGATGLELGAFHGTASFDWFGAALSAGGDLNGDGRPDVVVGAPRHDDDTSAPGSVRALSSAPLALAAAPHAVPLTTGGTQALTLSLPDRAGLPYLLVGSAAGTSPPLQVGPVLLPLAFEPVYLPYTLAVPQTGLLDASGGAEASVVVPPGLCPSLAGLLLHHAVLTFDATGLPTQATNAAPLTLVGQ